MADEFPELTRLVTSLALADAKLSAVLNLTSQVKILGELMSAELDRMIEEVEENKTVVGSAVALLQSLAARLRAIAGDSAKVAELANELDAKNKELADAVVANTPS